MARNQHLSNAAASAATDAVTPMVNGGAILIYAGVQPATADTPVSGQTLLASLPLPNPAFHAAVGGVAAMISPTSATAVGSGTATWFRFVKSDQTTGVFDGSVGAPGDLVNIILATTVITVGATIAVNTFTYTADET